MFQPSPVFVHALVVELRRELALEAERARVMKLAREPRPPGGQRAP